MGYSRRAAFGGWALIGLASGWVLSQRRIVAHRRDLFSPAPIKRLAAMAYLEGSHDIDSVRLLRDYVAWEPQPMLRRRGERVLRRLQLELR